MKRLLTFCLLLITILAKGQLPLSEKAEIHVITCGPYQGELYSAFGHSAFRVVDHKLGHDIIYNYGVFSFNQPNFYLNFAKGNLYYKLGVSHYPQFVNFYIRENRYVHEQVLNLTHSQKQRLFDYLQWNAKPENQYYSYDYYYNNCATKIRDAVLETFGDSVHFDGSYVETDYSLRELTDLYLEYQPWGDFAIDLFLGLPIDKKATPFMYMFLPDYIEQGFAHATIIKDGKKVPLVKDYIVTYNATPQTPEVSFFTPTFLFSTILWIGLIITIFGYRKKKYKRGVDVFLFAFTGLVGTILLTTWTATDHHASDDNLNILWAISLHLPLAWFLLKRQIPKWLLNYFLAVGLLQIALLLSWPFLPQMLHTSLISLVILLAVRALYIWYYHRKVASTT